MKYAKPWILIALVIIILRNLLEQIGGPGFLITVFGVSWLALLVPIVLGFRISQDRITHPYKTLLKEVACFTVATRFFVAVNYVGAKILGSTLGRFTAVVGGDETSLVSALGAVLLTFVGTTVVGTLIGMLLGSIVLFLGRRTATAT